MLTCLQYLLLACLLCLFIAIFIMFFIVDDSSVLHSTSRLSYMASVNYTGNSSPECKLVVDYTLSENAQLQVRMVYGSNSSRVIATLPYNETYG